MRHVRNQCISFACFFFAAKLNFELFKIVQQHTQGVVRDITQACTFVEIFISFLAVEEF